MTLEVNDNAPAPVEGLPVEAVPVTPLAVTVNTPPETKAEAPAGKVEAVSYNATGDVGLDMTLRFVGDLGYSPEHPAMQAAINGDFSLLEAELAAKGVKGYDAYIKLGQKAYGDVSAKTQARQAKDREAVEGIAGGPENWTAMTTWASANADDAEKASLQGMLSKGGLEAQMAATWLASNYARATGAAPTEGAGRPVASVKSGASAVTPLDPQSYGREVVKARQAHKGRDFESSPAYTQLVQRRMAFRA